LDDNKINEICDKARSKGWLNGFDFSILIQELTIPEGAWVIDTGNFENVNAEVALRLIDRIRRHPIIWKLFFMVA
jgi:hypothetical protein